MSPPRPGTPPRQYDFESRKPRDFAESLLAGSKLKYSHVRSRDTADRYCQQLIDRLRFADSARLDDVRDSLRELCGQCHVNIDWYSRKTVREINLRRFYFVGSLVLLAAIPVVITYFPKLLGWLEIPDKGANTTAQITAVLTGLLGVHRGLSAWMEKRVSVASYWEAMADLKTTLYDFESAWQEKSLTTKQDAADMKKSVDTAIQHCREVVQAETKAYFKSLAYPELDLGDILKTAGDTATGIVKGHTVATVKPKPKPGVTPQAAKAKQLDVIVKNLQAELERVDKLFADAVKNGDETAQSAHAASRKAALEEINKAYLERAKNV